MLVPWNNLWQNAVDLLCPNLAYSCKPVQQVIAALFPAQLWLLCLLT